MASKKTRSGSKRVKNREESNGDGALQTEKREKLDEILKVEDQIKEAQNLMEALKTALSDLIGSFCEEIGTHGVTDSKSGRTLYFGTCRTKDGSKSYFIKSGHSPKVPAL